MLYLVAFDFSQSTIMITLDVPDCFHELGMITEIWDASAKRTEINALDFSPIPQTIGNILVLSSRFHINQSAGMSGRQGSNEVPYNVTSVIFLLSKALETYFPTFLGRSKQTLLVGQPVPGSRIVGTKRKSETATRRQSGSCLNSLPDYLRAAVRFFASSPLSESLEQATRRVTGVQRFLVNRKSEPAQNPSVELLTD